MKQKNIQIALAAVILILFAAFLIKNYWQTEIKEQEIKKEAVSGAIVQLENNSITVGTKHWNGNGDLVKENKRISVQPTTKIEVILIDYKKELVTSGPKINFEDLKIGEGVEIVYIPKAADNAPTENDFLGTATNIIVYTR